MRAGSSSRSNGREWAEKFAYCPSKPTEQAAGETHHVLRESDKLSSSACPAGEKQVRIDAQTRVLVNKTHVEVVLFKSTIPVDHARDAAGRRSIWVERSQSLLYNLKSSDTENCEIR